MADAADNAGAVIERHLSNALARHQLPVTVAGAMDIDCEDCGAEIPAQRRQAAPWATTCIDCQSIREARGRHVR
ncbi:TraR/DksA family transcriptional regulator [Salinicola corii]|uniref:TraR/DksA family transcriptional regulator n=1 Tax=Salinicola corii TaxID=2606937 RepID=A0A640WCE2_9GAMM|nr:TraR/DksA C4-type zinc finger protein [Salinicola corii]KAA0016649.1 TraR/DksA family transcriptional regulator [Salinicola corii]